MRKLNRKGFTLIELLAVIVILAIIIVVTVPTIINTIADARKNSLWNLAGSVANSYDTIVAQDLLASEPVIPEGSEATTTWTCISTDLAKVLNISGDDVVLNGQPVVGDSTGFIHMQTDLYEEIYAGIYEAGEGVTTYCSSIRVNSNNEAEVFLIANSTGKFNIAGEVNFAYSEYDNGIRFDGEEVK